MTTSAVKIFVRSNSRGIPSQNFQSGNMLTALTIRLLMCRVLVACQLQFLASFETLVFPRFEHEDRRVQF